MFIKCYFNCIVYLFRKYKVFKKKNDLYKGDKYLNFFKLYFIGFLYCIIVYNSVCCIYKELRIILWVNLYILNKGD